VSLSKPYLLTLAFVVAQAWIPQTACDRTPVPPPAVDPWANAPVTDTVTTSDGVRIGVQTLITNVQIPWALAFAPDGRLFFTERPGRVRVVQNGALLAQPALTLPDALDGGEGGVLGLALHPAFAQNRLVYLAYTRVRQDGSTVNRIMRYRESSNTLTQSTVLLDDITASSGHDGARVRFGPDGKLYVTFGDAGVPDYAQNLAVYAGKILRLNDDGTTPADNPFGSPVWSWGHRHPQGIDWHPTTGDMWATEHGNIGNDELNLIQRGQNYGWPVIEAAETRPDMVAPVLFYPPPSIAPSGLSFYTSTRIPQFTRNIFFATLRGEHLHRVVLSPSAPRVPIAEEQLFQGRFGRIRDVVTGPDGAIYFCTSNRDGRTVPGPADDRIARIIPVQ
jgi:glucose/arabinose dehydrogenase